MIMGREDPIEFNIIIYYIYLIEKIKFLYLIGRINKFDKLY